MNDEKVNLLVPEDGLNDLENNIDKQYTEELDFSNLQEEIDKAKNAVNPVPLEPNYEVPEEVQSVPLEPNYEQEVKDVEVEEPNTKEYNPGENPNAKVVLNKTEDIKEEIKKEDIKLDLKSNKSLMFVLGLGLFLLIIVFLIPYITK